MKCHFHPAQEATHTDSVAEAKRNWIRCLLSLGLKPELEIIARGIPVRATADWEQWQIKNDKNAWLLNSTKVARVRTRNTAGTILGDAAVNFYLKIQMVLP